MPAEIANPARLDQWLLEYCRREKVAQVPTRAVQQCGPNGLRDKTTLAESVKELEELGRVRSVQVGRRKIIQINPALLTGAGT